MLPDDSAPWYFEQSVCNPVLGHIWSYILHTPKQISDIDKQSVAVASFSALNLIWNYNIDPQKVPGCITGGYEGDIDTDCGAHLPYRGQETTMAGFRTNTIRYHHHPWRLCAILVEAGYKDQMLLSASLWESFNTWRVTTQRDLKWAWMRCSECK